MPTFALASVVESLEIDKLDDSGMYIWAGILAVVGLVASFAIAVWWKRRKTAQAGDE